MCYPSYRYTNLIFIDIKTNMKLEYFLAMGVVGQWLVLKQMIKYKNRSNFSTPFFTIQKSAFIKPFKTAQATLGHYKTVIVYDNILALCYFLTYMSIHLMAQDNTFAHLHVAGYLSIPCQSLLDWLENYLLNQHINQYLDTQTVKSPLEFFVVSTMKWILAVMNGIIVLIDLYWLMPKIVLMKK